MRQIATAIERAITYLNEHPEEARYTDSAAVASLEEGLRVRVEGSDGSLVVTDMPTGVGGSGSPPNPGWLFRAALAACDTALIAMHAAQEGVELQRLQVTVDSESDDRGILGMDESVPAGPLSIRVAVEISAGADGERLRSIAANGMAHCPVHDVARRAVETEVEVRTG